MSILSIQFDESPQIYNLSNHHPKQNIEHFYHSRRAALCPFSVSLPLSPPLATAFWLLSPLMIFSCSKISCVWNYTVFTFWCSVFCSAHDIWDSSVLLHILVVASFIWLSSSQLYEYITVWLSLSYCWVFELFPFYAIMNKNTMNIFVWVFLWTYVFISHD